MTWCRYNGSEVKNLIKMIAVDMDGTFLRTGMTYDEERFNRIYEKMKEKGITFVIASGNQYYQLRSFFKDVYHEFYFAADNGNFLVQGNDPVYNTSLDKDYVNSVVDGLNAVENISFVVCGKLSAYMKEDSPEMMEIMNRYYKSLKVVDSLKDLDDEIIKFAVFTHSNDAADYVARIQDLVGSDMVALPTSSFNVDVIKKGITKGTAIAYLQEKLGVTPEETIAFGDHANDIEMLSRAKYSYAMENAIPEVKQAAAFTAPSNNEDGVLKVLETYLF